MATYPRGDLIVLATPARYDEEEKRVVPSVPMDPQPADLDSREPPNGHYGMHVRYPNGEEKGWYPPAPPADPAPKPLTRYEFLSLFTPQEKAAALALKASALALFWLNYEAAETFERDHPDTVAGLAALVATSCITQERTDEVIAGWPKV
jgi:hypothetical protein